MNWAKFLSREFLVSLTLIVIATVALFTGVCTFVEWASACGGFAAWWMGALTVQKIKASNGGSTGSDSSAQ